MLVLQLIYIEASGKWKVGEGVLAWWCEVGICRREDPPDMNRVGGVLKLLHSPW